MAPRTWSIQAKALGRTQALFGMLPFLVLIAVYLIASHLRLQANLQDKLLPSPHKMVQAVERLTFEANQRNGEFTLVNDTVQSLKRLSLGLGAAALVGLLIGLNMGMVPLVGALL